VSAMKQNNTAPKSPFDRGGRRKPLCCRLPEGCPDTISAPFAIQEGFKLLEKVAVIPCAMSDNQYRAFDFHLWLARAINA